MFGILKLDYCGHKINPLLGFIYDIEANDLVINLVCDACGQLGPGFDEKKAPTEKELVNILVKRITE